MQKQVDVKLNDKQFEAYDILTDMDNGEVSFRKNVNAPDANDYEASDVKKWLEKWAKNKGVIA